MLNQNKMNKFNNIIEKIIIIFINNNLLKIIKIIVTTKTKTV